MVAWSTQNGQVALVGGLRSPFVRAGDALRDLHVGDLMSLVMRQVMYEVSWPASRLDEVIVGNVVMPADAANLARVAALYAGVPEHVPALTVQRNCASGMEAIAQGASGIQHGRVQAVLAGGAESMSTIPLLFPSQAIGLMMRLAKAKSAWQKIGAAAAVRAHHFRPRSALLMGLTDPTCGLVMGSTGEVLAHEFGIGRSEQDHFALKSHEKAVAAIHAGQFQDQITPLYVGKKFRPIVQDIGPREKQSAVELARLKPIFDKRDGTVTVGNACQVTDGAVALLMMSSEMARAEGMSIRAHVRAYATAALEPQRMGLGPVYAIDQLLDNTKLSLRHIDLIEINEAFAVQVLACLKAMASNAFCQRRLGRISAIGEIDPNKLNVNGGAIALGHPVGATGSRLVLNLMDQMNRRDAEFGLAALCVGGGQGAAMLLQRH